MLDILTELNNKDYINKLNKNYDVHFCRTDEVDQLVLFIDTYWKKNHIFVLSRELLDWQHYNRREKRYNFVIAKQRYTGEIHSILGFVPTSQFDEKITNLEVWPCIWKAREDIHVKGLGVALYFYLKENMPIETISILGISEIALSIYKHWNFTTGRMKHWYLPCPMRKYFCIAKGLEKYVEKEIKDTDVDEFLLKEYTLEEYEKIPLKSALFEKMDRYKSKDYYIKRFYQHPMYKYKFWGIEDKYDIVSMMITRECVVSSAKCLRIVDFIGKTDGLTKIKYQLRKLLIDNEYEYVDWMENGLQESILKKTGFIDKQETFEVVIPNYFEPFVQENISLDWAFKTIGPEKKGIFYKADADQDRPNQVI